MNLKENLIALGWSQHREGERGCPRVGMEPMPWLSWGKWWHPLPARGLPGRKASGKVKHSALKTMLL